jgi:hypothetical protein
MFMFGAARIYAIFVNTGTLESLPIDRLVHNLEEAIAANPEDAQSHVNLARVHAMAYALKSKPTDVFRALTVQGQPPALFFDPGSKGVPFTERSTDDPALIKMAADHLAKAIVHYRQGLELNQNNLVAKLGYGWCLDQSGLRDEAITVYRQVVLEGWTSEARLDANGRLASSVSVTASSLTSEAASYLMPLLDPERDRDEIVTLKQRVILLGVGARGVSPIVIPLSGEIDAAKLIDRTARVSFDADGSGIRKSWSWITPTAGWLVYAPAGAGRIDSALQLFGNVTFWLFWENGYQALRSLDDNGDGVLDGTELKDLAIWRDANGNGIAEDGEVKPLSDWGIVSLNCAHERTPARSDYMAFSPKGVTFKDGRTRPTYDIILYTQRAETE